MALSQWSATGIDSRFSPEPDQRNSTSRRSAAPGGLASSTERTCSACATTPSAGVAPTTLTLCRLRPASSSFGETIPATCHSAVPLMARSAWSASSSVPTMSSGVCPGASGPARRSASVRHSARAPVSSTSASTPNSGNTERAKPG